MDLFPVIVTERLVLRQLKQEDSNDLFYYFSKDEVTRYMDLESLTDIGQAEDLIQIWEQRFMNNKGFRWGISLKPETRIIGTCGFHNWMKEHFKAEIGYELRPEFWQKGIMSEALKELLRFGFEEMGLNRIEAFIDPRNIGSRKALEKIGLREEGLLKDYFFEKNQFVDAVIFAILKNEYYG